MDLQRERATAVARPSDDSQAAMPNKGRMNQEPRPACRTRVATNIKLTSKSTRIKKYEPLKITIRTEKKRRE